MVNISLKETINALPAYASYPVDQNPRQSTHGENTRAGMTSILLELGFHTNAEDSATLRSSTFRTAAMKGVEKATECTNWEIPARVWPLQGFPT